MGSITAFDFGEKIATNMVRLLREDWVASKVMATYGILADMVYRSGYGNYLELGTWRGASAVVARLTKNRFDLGGRVICVDHFAGYHGENIGPRDTVCMLSMFGILDEVEINVCKTRPFPKNKAGEYFDCAYIDADHLGENPYLDFVEIEKMVSQFILMDDYDMNHPELMDCVKRINAEFFGIWKMTLPREAPCAFFERIANG